MKDRISVAVFVLFLVLKTVLPSEISPLYMSITEAMKQEGDELMVICRDRSGSPVKWRSPRGHNLGAKSRPKVDIASHGTTLTFESLTVTDSGVYSCHTTGQPEHVGRLNLTVMESIVFSDTPTLVEGEEGTDVVLKCEATGTTEITWHFNGNAIEDGDKIKYDPLADGLYVKNLTKEDKGNYTCSAINSNTGETRNLDILLIVRYKPVWKDTDGSQEDVYGPFNQRIDLICEVDAYPQPKCRFQKKEKPRNIKPLIGNEYSEKGDGDSYKCIVTILVKQNSLGPYECQVSNKLGNISKTFVLKNGTLPEPPQYLELSGENSNLLEIKIKPPVVNEDEAPEMAPIGFNLQYRPKEEEEWLSADFEITEDNRENSYTLMDLQHDTWYEVKAATRNPTGLSAYTNSSFFHTLPNSADSYNKNSSVFLYVATLVVILTSLFA